MDDELTITHNGFPLKGVADSITEGNLRIAVAVIAQAKELAPRDKGQLVNSIMYQTPLTDGGFNDSSGEHAENKIQVFPKANEAYVGANLDHAVYQEFGTRNMAPQPYLRPAIDIVAKGTDAMEVLKKIQVEEMRGALKKGQKRETF